MQMLTANQLRQLHEERIAPYINKNNELVESKKARKESRWPFSLFNKQKKSSDI